MAQSQLVDQIHLLVQAGNGGNGCESYFHRKDKKQVPDGGDGGLGGSIIFLAVKDAPPIVRLQFRQHIVGESGGHGGSNRKRGKNGEDMTVLVPNGASLFDRQNGLVIREKMAEDEQVVVAQGGRGGSGNHGGKEATVGEKGAVIDLEVSIRLMADVYLIGLPNSGKSSILKQLTRSQTKVEAYPFSTRTPELGVWMRSDYEQLTLCDLPSLYGASHEGRGMGNEFLKHLEQAKAILYVLDPVSVFAATVKEGYETLRGEIEKFNKQYLDIPSAIILNKMDAAGAKEKFAAEKWEAPLPVFQTSAQTGEGMDNVKKFLEGFLEDSQ